MCEADRLHVLLSTPRISNYGLRLQSDAWDERKEEEKYITIEILHVTYILDATRNYTNF